MSVFIVHGIYTFGQTDFILLLQTQLFTLDLNSPYAIRLRAIVVYMFRKGKDLFFSSNQIIFQVQFILKAQCL